MSHVAKVIKALKKAQAAEEQPTAFESMVMLKLVGQLQANTLRAEEECSEYNSSEESFSDEDSDDSSEDSDDSVVADNKPKRKYTKGPRAKGYALYLKNGGTREKWSNKSDKYKDNYYEKHK